MSLRGRVPPWPHDGSRRPAFALEPDPGQESVWDYPRPPRLAPDAREVVIVAAGVEVARTRRAIRVLETASPPTFYLHPEDVDLSCLVAAPGASYCEWKGEARYWSVVVPGAVFEKVAWSYPSPEADFTALADWIGFYPSPIACTVDGIRVLPQPGRFYAGWVTPEVVGPFKGEPGTSGW